MRLQGKTQYRYSIERSNGGLGIGLTIVKRIIQKHDGYVEATSEGPNKGSEFVVNLPIHESPAMLQAVEEKLKTVKSEQLTKILIIEDNEGAAKLLSKMLLHFWNHKVEMAFDGVSGVEKAIEMRPDLIICDIGLPRLSGYDVVKKLREQPGFDKTLIVALTGYGQEEDKQRALQFGFDEHMTKPASVEGLAKLFVHPKMAKGL